MKIFQLLLLIFLLSGCATYRIQKGQEAPYDKGYVVTRNGFVFSEYTVGKNNTFPDQKTAQERFKRRRSMVEHYYKQMGSLENKFKLVLWDFPTLILKTALGVFKLPFIAISEYKYEHNPKYHEKVLKENESKDALEKTRMNTLRERLDKYIQEDLAKEPGFKEETQVAIDVQATKTAEEKISEVKPSNEQKSEEVFNPETKENVENVLPKEELKPIVLAGPIKAIIIAKPQKGFSPLLVHFYGYKSHSKAGKIISYHWDFGDGDASDKENPLNTYWCTTFGSTVFKVSLTVTDDKGNFATADAIVEVKTKP